MDTPHTWLSTYSLVWKGHFSFLNFFSEEYVTMNNSTSIIVSNTFFTNTLFTFDVDKPVSVDNSFAAMAQTEPGTQR